MRSCPSVARLVSVRGGIRTRTSNSTVCALDTEKVDDPVRFDMSKTNRTGITTLQVPKVSTEKKAAALGGLGPSSRRSPGDELDAAG